MPDVGKLSVLYFGDQWDDLWRRRQQLALHLSRQPDVAAVVYVELPLPLTSLARYAAGRADRDAVARWRRVLRRGTVFRYEGVTIVTPIVPFRLYSGALASAWNARFAWPQVRRAWVRGRPPGAKTIFWAGHPYAGLFLDRVPRALLCYDHTEDFSTFRHLSPACRTLFAELDRRLTARADTLFVQTQPHLTNKRARNPNTVLLPNAADIARLVAASGGPEPPEMARIPRPRIGFTGSVGYRVDMDLLESLARKRPEWSFVLIGPVDDQRDQERLAANGNVYLLGRRPYEELGRYLPWIDVGLIPYRILPEMGNPLKLYDYLAFGKPVVGTPILGLEEMGEWVALGQTPADLTAALERALSESDTGLQERRKAFARQQTWQARAQTAWDVLSARLAGINTKTSGP